MLAASIAEMQRILSDRQAVPSAARQTVDSGKRNSVTEEGAAKGPSLLPRYTWSIPSRLSSLAVGDELDLAQQMQSPSLGAATGGQLPARRRRRLIVVANRLPVSLSRNAGTGQWDCKMSSGGLVSALRGMKFENLELEWLGWPGAAVPEEEQPALSQRLAQESMCSAVFLEKDCADAYYNGFSNSVLWRNFHYQDFPEFPVSNDNSGVLTAVTHDPALFTAYQEANRKFAEAVLKSYQPGDIVWVHDYHLMLVPALLRKVVPEMVIGFFLHTAFPSSEIFRMLPMRKEILLGTLGADLISFHTFDYSRHFLSSVSRIIGLQPRGGLGLEYQGRQITVGIHPIGIDSQKFVDATRRDDVQKRIFEFREMYGGCRILLGVDRLDPIKGIPHRLQAFEMFLQKYPEWRGKVVMVQIAVPSRVDVQEYKILLRNVNETIGRINGTYGSLHYTPIHYLFQGIGFEDLCALYAASDVCLITSLRDGMNLVASEFIACQQFAAEIYSTSVPSPSLAPENGTKPVMFLQAATAAAAASSSSLSSSSTGPEPEPAPLAVRVGTLVLSEFAGCANSLCGCIRINPWNTLEVCQAIHAALTMGDQERLMKQESLFDYVSKHTASWWGGVFLKDLLTAHRRSVRMRVPKPLDTEKLAQCYRSCKRRIFVFDYGGTLTESVALPQLTKPPQEMLASLLVIASDPLNTVVVVSARPKKQVSRWLGRVAGSIYLAAENGIFLRRPGSDDFEQIFFPFSRQWMDSVKDVFQHFSERTPGSICEYNQETVGLVWTGADPEFGELMANELRYNLEAILGSMGGFEIVTGDKYLEARPARSGKRHLMQFLLGMVYVGTWNTSDDKQFAREQAMRTAFGDLEDQHMLVYVGDDSTDEEVFQLLSERTLKLEWSQTAQAGDYKPLIILPRHTFCIKVGESAETYARYTLPAQQDVAPLLELLVRCSSAGSSEEPGRRRPAA